MYHINEMFTNGETGSMKQCLKRKLIRLVSKVAEVFEDGMVA